jgi:hypothetical protein
MNVSFELQLYIAMHTGIAHHHQMYFSFYIFVNQR